MADKHWAERDKPRVDREKLLETAIAALRNAQIDAELAA
jgi:hypothetical protein